MYEDKGGKSGNENSILSRSSTFASTHSNPKLSKIGGEKKEGTDKGTFRIVLLQPNYAMARDARNSLSLHDPLRAIFLGSRESESKEAAKRFSGELQEVFIRKRTDFPAYVKEIHGTGGLHDFSRIESASESEVIKIKSSAQQNRLLAGRPRRYCWRVGEGLRGINMREQAPCAVFQREKFSPLGISSPDGWEDE